MVSGFKLFSMGQKVPTIWFKMAQEYKKTKGIGINF